MDRVEDRLDRMDERIDGLNRRLDRLLPTHVAGLVDMFATVFAQAVL